jgi:hypothetical protein
MAGRSGLSKSTIGRRTLLAAFNLADGTVISGLHRQHRASELKKFLTTIDKMVPAELDIHLICDKYATHKTPAIKAWLARHPRFHMRSQVERWFGFLTDQMIGRGTYKSVQVLEKDIRDWISQWNQDPRPCAWKKTAEEILESLARYCRRISGAGQSSAERGTLLGHRAIRSEMAGPQQIRTSSARATARIADAVVDLVRQR